MRIPYKLHELLLKFSAYKTFCEGEQSEQITEAVDRLNKALYIHKTRRLKKEDEKLSYYYFWSYSTNHSGDSPPPHYVILWTTYPAVYSSERVQFYMHGPMSITIREIDKMIDNLSSCGEEFIDGPEALAEILTAAEAVDTNTLPADIHAVDGAPSLEGPK